MTPEEWESLRDVIKGIAATLLLFLMYAGLPLIGASAGIIMYAGLSLICAPAGIIAPFPALFYSLKQGRIAGLAIVLVTLAVLALFNPAIAIFYLFQAGLLSLFLADFLRRGEGGARSIAGAVAGIMILTVVSAAIYTLRSGINLNETIRAGIDASITQTAALYQKGGFSAEELTAIQEAFKQSVALFGTIYPAALLLLLVVFAGLNLSLLRKSAGYLPRPPLLGPLSAYRNPDHLIWLLIVPGFCLLLDNPVVFQPALNILIVVVGLYFIQGLAIIVMFFDRFAITPFMRGLFYVLLALQSFLVIGVALFGIFDLWFNFRTPKTGKNL